MPAPVVASLAKKAGVGTGEAEKAWNKIKSSVVGAKLNSGRTIGGDEKQWKDEEWAYVTGALKNALSKDKKESTMRTVESLISKVVAGTSPSRVLENLAEFSGTQERLPGMGKVTASFEYTGMPDFWGGNGTRWKDTAGCVFAYYGSDTTNAEVVDQWVDDFMSGGGDFDGKDAFNNVGEPEIRSALENMFRNWEADKDKLFDPSMESDPADSDEEDAESPMAVALIELDDSEDDVSDEPTEESMIDRLLRGKSVSEVISEFSDKQAKMIPAKYAHPTKKYDTVNAATRAIAAKAGWKKLGKAGMVAAQQAGKKKAKKD